MTPLKRLRRARGLTQNALAALSGVSARTIGQIEAGALPCARPKTLAALARALEVDAGAFQIPTAVPAGRLHTAAKKQVIYKALHRLCADDPPFLVIAMTLFKALCDAESRSVGLAAEARFWLKFGDGRDWIEIFGADVLFDRVLDDLTPLPGEGTGPEALRLMRLMDLEHIA